MFLRNAFLMDAAGDGSGGAAAGGAAAGGEGGAAAGANGSNGAGGAAAFDWKTAGLDDSGLSLVTERQWKSPADLVTSYRNLEKLTGVPADQILKLPKDDSPDAWNPIYDKLGRPKTADEYGLPVPEGDKGEFAKTAATWMHEAGLNGKQARNIAEKWNAHVAAEMTKNAEAAKARVNEEVTQLKADWGPQFDAHAALVDKAAQAFGLSDEHLKAMRDSMGPRAAMKFLHAVGSKLGVEGDFVSGEGKVGANAFSTPEAAQARIAALRKDQAWVARFSKGDVEARAEMRRLHQAAYPGDTVM